jgi:hypothetical protein
MNLLKELTLIIPVKIESFDRYFNVKTVLGFLNHHFSTNIIIKEASFDGNSKLDFLDNFKNLNIRHENCILSEGTAYHRTKYLNEMLNETKTELVANYDCDVLLPVDSIVAVYDLLLQTDSDFSYPYQYGYFQKKLHYENWWKKENQDNIRYDRMLKFNKSFDLKLFDEDPNAEVNTSFFGHCVFAKTKSYKKAYGENEDFISYGPEDQERAYRFEKLGYRIYRHNGYVYHIEHSRTSDSGPSNPHFCKNFETFNFLKTLSKEDLDSYYMNRSYLKKYESFNQIE